MNIESNTEGEVENHEEGEELTFQEFKDVLNSKLDTLESSLLEALDVENLQQVSPMNIMGCYRKNKDIGKQADDLREYMKNIIQTYQTGEGEDFDDETSRCSDLMPGRPALLQ